MGFFFAFSVEQYVVVASTGFAFRAAFFHQQHGAGAALAPAAAVFNVSQVQLIPDDLKKGIMNGYVQIILLPIYIKGYCAFFHDVYLLKFLL